MKSNTEWELWGKSDPLYGVASWAGRERGGENPWTDEDFYALGEDWLDFDLLETFVETVDPDEEIGGFDLLTMEEMWEQVQKVCASRVEKTKKRGEDVVVWQKGEGEELVCPFTPEALLHIFDTETHGDFVD